LATISCSSKLVEPIVMVGFEELAEAAVGRANTRPRATVSTAKRNRRAADM